MSVISCALTSLKTESQLSVSASSSNSQFLSVKCTILCMSLSQYKSFGLLTTTAPTWSRDLRVANVLSMEGIVRSVRLPIVVCEMNHSVYATVVVHILWCAHNNCSDMINGLESSQCLINGRDRKKRPAHVTSLEVEAWNMITCDNQPFAGLKYCCLDSLFSWCRPYSFACRVGHLDGCLNKEVAGQRLSQTPCLRRDRYWLMRYSQFFVFCWLFAILFPVLFLIGIGIIQDFVIT